MKLSETTIVLFDTPGGWTLPTRYPVKKTAKYAASTAVLAIALNYGYNKFCEYFGEEEEEED